MIWMVVAEVLPDAFKVPDIMTDYEFSKAMLD